MRGVLNLQMLFFNHHSFCTPHEYNQCCKECRFNVNNKLCLASLLVKDRAHIFHLSVSGLYEAHGINYVDYLTSIGKCFEFAYQ